jgi:hypothetical protein
MPSANLPLSKNYFFGGKAMKAKESTWHGEKDRLLQVCRPCPCGCDDRGGRTGVGYLTGSDAAGNGFTIWIESEEVFHRLEKLLALE